MKVNCPGCQRSYKVDDHRIPESGIKMKCPKCGKAFKVSKGGEATAAASPQPAAVSPAAFSTGPGNPSGPQSLPSVPPVISGLFGDEPPAQKVPPQPPLQNESGEFGAVDLPGLSSGTGDVGIDLPQPASLHEATSEPIAIDLPTPAEARPLPDAGGDDPLGVDLPGPLESPSSAPIELEMPTPAAVPAAGIPIAMPLPQEDMPPIELGPDLLESANTPATEPMEVQVASTRVGSDDTTGGVDLPAPAAPAGPLAETDIGVLDLPTPAQSPTGGVTHEDITADIDLPTPVSNDNVDLPTPRTAPADETDFGSIDLPTPAIARGAPAADPGEFGGIDLPTPAAKAGGPPPAPQQGGFADLPTPAMAAGGPPPAPQQGGFADLPTPAMAAGGPPPAPQQGGLTDLPTPAMAAGGPPPAPQQGGFGDINLPSTAPAPQVPPTPPAAPTPPLRGAGDDFGNIDLGGSASTPSGAQEAAGFGEINLESGPPDTVRESAAEFDGFPIATEDEERQRRMSGMPGTAAPIPDQSMGSGLDLQTDDVGAHSGQMLEELAPQTAAEGRKSEKSFLGRRRIERESRRSKSGLLLFLILLIGGGGALHFTDYGAFGVHQLLKVLPRVMSGKIIERTYVKVEKRLAIDTWSSIDAALVELETSLKELPDHEQLRLIGVFLHNWKQIRFGDNKDSEQQASRLLGSINLNDEDGDYAALVLATQALLSDDWDGAVAAMAGPVGETPSGLMLVAQANLSKGKIDLALKKASVLDDKERSHRSKYLLARAYAAKPKSELDALNKLKELIDKQPTHPDGLMLYLRLALVHDETLDLGDAEKRLTAIMDGQINSNKQKAHAFGLMGAVLLRQNRFSDAKKAFANSEKLNSSDPVMLVGKGEMALMANDASAAITFYSRAVSLEPHNMLAMLGQVDCKYRLGNLSEAKAAITAVLKNFPNNAKGHYLFGRIEAALKNLESAEAEFNKSLELDATHMDAYVALSELYLRNNEEQKALDILAKAAKSIDDSPVIHITFADAYAARGDFETALAELDKALAIDAKQPKAYFKKAQMYRKLRNIEEAETSLKEVENIDANFPGLFLEQGRLMELTGAMAEALETYEKALEDSPDNLIIQTRVGAALHLLGENERAEKILTSILEKDAESVEANFYLGEVYRVTGRIPEAVLTLQTAQKLAGGQSLYHLRYGAALLELRRFDEARREFERAAELDPDTPEYYYRTGTLELRQGAAKSAIKALKKAIELKPDYGAAFLNIGLAYEQLSKIKDAADYYEIAVKKIRDNPELYFRLALLKLRLKGQRVSLPFLKKAVDLAEESNTKYRWLPEALYRLGVAQVSGGASEAAIKSFKSYLDIAPENDIDRSEVLAHLERLGANPD